MKLLKKQEQRKGTETFFIIMDWRGIIIGEQPVIYSNSNDKIYTFQSYEEANENGKENIGTFELKKITRTFTESQFCACLQVINSNEGGSLDLSEEAAYDAAEKAYNDGMSVNEYWDSLK